MFRRKSSIEQEVAALARLTLVKVDFVRCGIDEMTIVSVFSKSLYSAVDRLISCYFFKGIHRPKYNIRQGVRPRRRPHPVDLDERCRE